MKVLDQGVFDFDASEYPLIRGILRSAEGNIGSRDDKDADDRKQLRIIKRMLENLQ